MALNHLADGGPVGVAGFSLGGYTAAAVLGARIDVDMSAAIATRRVTVPSPPEYPTLVDELTDRIGTEDIAAWINESGDDYADRRVTAGLLICPAQATRRPPLRVRAGHAGCGSDPHPPRQRGQHLLPRAVDRVEATASSVASPASPGSAPPMGGWSKRELSRPGQCPIRAGPTSTP